ncbi:PAS domain-containing sensor histidine kinase [Flavobacterium caeni]|uniref:histidine kinase n=1 Tax=Flavobacterium caeni TaxID=490189 RepID=A0A1G5FR12_9FLAO|nr:PAS domain-containing sensor histidine kinase [Flavobacterium caeni]SCY41584.1 PAS domain S-box-containing protein [Flavobacterium caeni]
MTDYTQEYLETLLAASHDPILVLDGGYVIRKANMHFVTLFGDTGESVEGRSLFEIADRSWAIPELKDLLSRVLSENFGVENYALELAVADRRYSLLLNARQFADRIDGSTLLFLAIEDVTDTRQHEARIRQAEELRQQSEDLFKVVSDTAPVMIWMSGTDNRCYFFNKNWLDFTGRTLAQEVDQGWTEGVHPDDFERCQRISKTSFEARKEFYMEYRLRRKDGKYRWISDKGVPRYDIDDQFTGYVGSCMDIHDQKDFTDALESMVRIRTQELERSQSFLNSVLNSTYYGIASYEPIYNERNKINDFRILYSNPEVPANFGLTVADVVGKTCFEVYPGIFSNGVFDKLVRCMETGKSDTYEIGVDLNGKTLWLSAAIEKVNNTLTVTSKNITKEKEAALYLEQINEELNGKNKELASLTYIASHDLQEPLRKIQMFTSRILETDEAKLSEQSQQYFKSITSTALRMQNLIDAVLSYSRMESEKYKFERTNLNTLLSEVLLQMEEQIEEKGATIHRDELPTLKVVPIHFQQLFGNLLNNAIKYSKADVKPVISISATKETVNRQLYWKISMADNGIGFDPQYKEKIFEAFQRLHGKMEYVGTGIGLAICQKIAHKHNGFITADGQPDIGATFHLYIPAKE